MESTAKKFTIALGLFLTGCGAAAEIGPGPTPPRHHELPPQMDASITCQESRQRALLRAQQTEDPDERMARLAFVPVCP